MVRILSEYCVVGEVKAKVNPKVIEEVDKKIEELCFRYPSYARKRMIKVVYAMQVAEEAVEEARRRGITLLC